MNEEALRAILRDPSYPRNLRFQAYAALTRLAGGYAWQKACERIEELAGHRLTPSCHSTHVDWFMA